MHPRLESLGRLGRYYQVGIVNTLFGYSVYALLVSVGLNMFFAQIVGHILGVMFNYFSYSRHVFRNASASKLRFVLSYIVNYFVGLASLGVAAMMFASPYVAGLAALIVASTVNFFVLRWLVFARQIA